MARELFGWTWESFGCHAPNDSHEHWQRFYDDEPWWIGWNEGVVPSHIRNLEPLFRDTPEDV